MRRINRDQDKRHERAMVHLETNIIAYMLRLYRSEPLLAGHLEAFRQDAGYASNDSSHDYEILRKIIREGREEISRSVDNQRTAKGCLAFSRIWAIFGGDKATVEETAHLGTCAECCLCLDSCGHRYAEPESDLNGPTLN